MVVGVRGNTVVEIVVEVRGKRCNEGVAKTWALHASQ